MTGIADRPASVDADIGGQGPPETAPPHDRPWLRFEVGEVVPVLHAAAPTLSFRLEVEDRSDREVFMAALTVMIQIEPIKRTYKDAERERLKELLGETHRWGT